MKSFEEHTLKELMFIFDTVYDAQEHPIFQDEHGFNIENAFESYDEAFGAWIAYVLDNNADLI